MKENKVYQEHIEKLVTPIFNRVLQETPKNRTSVGRQPLISDNFSFYNPHNYRLYFDFKKENFHPFRPTEPTLKGRWGRLLQFNKKEWKTPTPMKGCILIVKKDTIQVNNLNDAKRWFSIRMGDIEARKQQIRDIHKRKIDEAINSIKEFISIYGGSSDFKLKRIWCEEKVMKDEPIDKLPLNMFFKSDNVKKAYNEPNIEYFGDPVGAANYFSNRGIEDIAPEIARAINNLGKAFYGFTSVALPTIQQLAYNMETHIEVLKGIDQSFKKFNKLLAERQKNLKEWL